MNKLVVDTNVFLRYLLKDNPTQYRKAVAIFEEGRENKIKIIVRQIVIFEIEFALSRFYKLPKDGVVEILRSLVTVKSFSVQNRNIFNLATKIYGARSVSFVDSFLVSTAKLAQAKFFTFDKKSNKLFDTL